MKIDHRLSGLGGCSGHLGRKAASNVAILRHIPLPSLWDVLYGDSFSSLICSVGLFDRDQISCGWISLFFSLPLCETQFHPGLSQQLVGAMSGCGSEWSKGA